LPAPSSGSWKAISLSSSRLAMGSRAQALTGMNALLIASELWVSLLPRQNWTFGCDAMAMCMNTSASTSMILPFTKKAQEIIDEVEMKYKFKCKGTGPISFHLGMDFFHDSDDVLCMAPKWYCKYFEKMIASCMSLFGTKPILNACLHSRKMITLHCMGHVIW
jgi:hypothetical protein